MVSSSDQFLERQGDGEGIIRPLLAPVKMKDSALWFADIVRTSLAGPVCAKLIQRGVRNAHRL
jgi:hypothetical protein